MNPVMLVRSCRQLLSDLEDDLQAFLHENVCKYQFLDMVCAIKVSKLLLQRMFKNSCKVITHTDTPVKKLRFDSKEDDNGGGESNERISYSTVLQPASTLLDYRGLQHSNITAARTIPTSMTRGIHSSKINLPISQENAFLWLLRET
jgi:hypothetical protein